MRIKKVTINPNTRIFCYCTACKEMKDDKSSYALLDSVFRYICKDCLKSGLFKFEEVL